MKRKLILSLVVVTLSLSLMGCGDSEIEQLKSISALESESDVQTMQLSKDDTDSMIYASVSDRTLLDLTTLDKLPDDMLGQVNKYIQGINDNINGVTGSSGYLSDSFTNYLLFEFEKTPYKWKENSYEIKGMDASSRSIVVDVTYVTTNETKPVKADSTIIKGEPDYSTKMQARFTHWVDVLNAKYGKRTNTGVDYNSMYSQFVNTYGDPQEIIAAQRGKQLKDYLNSDGGLNTYNCEVQPQASQSGAKMTVRYILVPKYAMGVDLGLSCKHMYVTDYTIASDPTDSMKVMTAEGNSVINDNIDKLFHSYYTAIDENNHDGLYSLTKDYQKWDKYYSDMFDTAYTKTGGYTISLFDVTGTTITCGVTRSRKIRAQGSEMTYPTYTERYLYKLELVDDKLQVSEETLLSSKISGEPTIEAKKAQTSGFSSQVSLSSDDKKQIENVLGNLGVLQVNNDTSSEKFGDTVDLSIGNSE